MASSTGIIFMTHFQSIGVVWFLLHFVFSLFQFCWSWSVRKEVEFSFESDKRSFSSNGRSLPILKILFIHENSRRDTKLTISLSSFVEIFLYPFLAMTVKLKNSADQHIEIKIQVWRQDNINLSFRSSPADSQLANLCRKYLPSFGALPPPPTFNACYAVYA